MIDDKFFWSYNRQPGKCLKRDIATTSENKPLVSIITSYFNSDEFMWQTINCVLNQTFPFWEWIIVDDGSTNKESIKYLKKVANIDSRIKIYHKINEGLAKGRDYAIKYSTTDYILPLDADDLIEPTYIETLYWTLETNKKAAWAFTNSLGFGKYIYLVDKDFNCEKMKTENQITATALIRKKNILSINGYGVAKRYVNEDWHLWLRMMANGYYPVQVGFYGFWYRRRPSSLLSEVNDTKKEENKLRLRDLKIEADKIKENVKANIYPKNETNKELEYNKLEFEFEQDKIKRKCILYIIPHLGPNKKLYKIIKEQYKENTVIIISLENSKFSPYVYRQKIEQYATVFDLNTFLDQKYWLGFIEYIINTRRIKKIYLYKNGKYDNQIRKIANITNEFIYKDSKKLYNLMILGYKFRHTILIRGIRKIYNMMKGLIKK